MRSRQMVPPGARILAAWPLASFNLGSAHLVMLDDEQIARVMGIRPGTVRSTAFRALDALGRALKETS